MWLLSLLRNEVHIQNLAESLRDGWVLLRVLDTIAPGCVRWQAAHRPPFKPLLRQPKSIENCNQVGATAIRLLHLQLNPTHGLLLSNHNTTTVVSDVNAHWRACRMLCTSGCAVADALLNAAHFFKFTSTPCGCLLNWQTLKLTRHLRPAT